MTELENDVRQALLFKFALEHKTYTTPPQPPIQEKDELQLFIERWDMFTTVLKDKRAESFHTPFPQQNRIGLGDLDLLNKYHASNMDIANRISVVHENRLIQFVRDNLDDEFIEITGGTSKFTPPPR